MASTAKSRSFFSRFLHDPSPKAEGLSNILETKNSLPLNNIMNEVRNLKSDAEIAIMRKTGQASGRAFTDAMRQVWRKEKDLAAFLDYQFKTQECDGSAYIPVVAGGQVWGKSHPWQDVLIGPECKYNSLHPEQSPLEVGSQLTVRLHLS